MKEVRNADMILVGNLKVKHHVRDLGVEWMTILKWILNEIVLGVDWIHVA
jgi:hypothetical protein